LREQEKSSKSYANVIPFGKLQEMPQKETDLVRLFTPVNNFLWGKTPLLHELPKPIPAAVFYH